MRVLILLAVIFCYQTIQATIVPANLIQIPITHQGQGITRQQYDEVLNRIYKIYRPIFEAQGKTLLIKRSWDSSIVNAEAYFGPNGESVIDMYGGFARYKGLTPEAFALAACHEIGHHIGGSPVFGDLGFSFEYKDMSVEGQADYFATAKCAKHYFAEDDVSDFSQLDMASVAICSNVYKQFKSIAICARTVSASYKLQMLFDTIYTPFEAVLKPVEITDYVHPAPDCRLNTSVAGALCERDVNESPVVGDPKQGYCIIGRDKIIASRPYCWYGVKDITRNFVPNEKEIRQRLVDVLTGKKDFKDILPKAIRSLLRRLGVRGL